MYLEILKKNEILINVEIQKIKETGCVLEQLL